MNYSQTSIVVLRPRELHVAVVHSQHEEVAAIAAADAGVVVEVGHVQRAARRRRRVHGRDAQDENLTNWASTAIPTSA